VELSQSLSKPRRKAPGASTREVADSWLQVLRSRSWTTPGLGSKASQAGKGGIQPGVQEAIRPPRAVNLPTARRASLRRQECDKLRASGL